MPVGPEPHTPATRSTSTSHAKQNDDDHDGSSSSKRTMKMTATCSTFDTSSQSSDATSDYAMPASSSTTTTGLSDVLRRLTYTTSISRGLAALSSEKSCAQHLWFSRFSKKQISVFLKTPHVVAGAVLSGTVAVPIPPSCDAFPFKKLVLELHGSEYVTELGSFSLETHTHTLVKKRILTLTDGELLLASRQSSRRDKLVLAFSIQVPPDLESTHQDKKAAIHYSLRGELGIGCCHEERVVQIQAPVRIYADERARIAPNALLYLPVQETAFALQSLHEPSKSGVQINCSLSRSIWSNEAPIYASISIMNASSRRLSDITIELLRRQQTFAQSPGGHQRPVMSNCTTVAHASAGKQGWMLPMEPGTNDQAVMVIRPPKSQRSMHNSKLVRISYALRVSVVPANARKERVMEVPITLIDSVSLDPPPSQHIPASSSHGVDTAKHACRQMLMDLFRRMPATDTGSDLEPDVHGDASDNGTSTIRHSTAVRHGVMWSPKQFGKRPSCLGNAGLDIRRKLNVATAREAWQGYTAEHCFISTAAIGASETSPITPTDERRPLYMPSTTIYASEHDDRKLFALQSQLACDLPPPVVHTF